VDVARVDGHVREVINDSVQDFEKVRQWIRLFIWLEWHAVLIESLHANSQRFGDIDAFDPLDKEPRHVNLVFDIVDEHVVIEAMKWCALFQKVDISWGFRWMKRDNRTVSCLLIVPLVIVW
jgi:hypothetical protein